MRCWCGAPATEKVTRVGCPLEDGEDASQVEPGMADREWLMVRLPVCEPHADPDRWPERIHRAADVALRMNGEPMLPAEVAAAIAAPGEWFDPPSSRLN